MLTLSKILNFNTLKKIPKNRWLVWWLKVFNPLRIVTPDFHPWNDSGILNDSNDSSDLNDSKDSKF